MLAGFDLRRWPLLFPVAAGTSGLALSRTDAVPVFIAIVLLLTGIATLLLSGKRLLAGMLAFGAVWGVADLIRDAGSVVVHPGWLDRDMVVSADIKRVEQLHGYKRYRLNHIVRQGGQALSGSALLYHHGSSSASASLQAGQRIRAEVRWREPRNYLNPGAFDYRGWCFDRNIALIGSLKGEPVIVRADAGWLERLRQRIRALLADADEHGVLAAVLLGERFRLSEQAEHVFAATGTAHLLAISGMHVGMAAGFVFVLVWFLLTRCEAWIVHLPVRNIALISGFLAAAVYGTMAGWPLPAIRAGFMLGAAALAWCLASRTRSLNTLLAALAVILLFDPSSIASLSLWLSFLATSALLIWAGRNRRHEAIPWSARALMAGKTLLWISLLATLATLPLIVATFGRIPVYSLPANLIIVPLYALIVMPAGLLAEASVLAGFDAIASMLVQISASTIEAGLEMLAIISKLPAGELWGRQPPLWAGALYLCGMLLGGCMLFRRRRMAAASAVALTLSIYLGVALYEPGIGRTEWVVWDVGQGAASTLLLPGKQVMVVDAPGRRGSRFNGGTSVADGLRHMGFTHVDVLVLSHAQSDHLGGALSLIQRLNRVGEIWLPDVPSGHADRRVQQIRAHAAANGIAVRDLARGDRMQFGEAEVHVIWPPRSHHPAKTNNASLVLQVSLPNRVRLLWPADIEAEAEQALVAAGLNNTDIMLMPHHGSASSSHAGFVGALKPDLAVAQTGFNNYFGFPKPSVLASYRRAGASVYNTANGAVLLRWPDSTGKADIEQWKPYTMRRREVTLQWLNSLM